MTSAGRVRAAALAAATLGAACGGDGGPTTTPPPQPGVLQVAGAYQIQQREVATTCNDAGAPIPVTGTVTHTPGASAFVLASVHAIAAWAFTRDVPHLPYWGQWRPTFSAETSFRGTLTGYSVGGIDVPYGRVPDESELWSRLERDSTRVRVAFVPAAAPPRLAPIARLVHPEFELHQLAQDGDRGVGVRGAQNREHGAEDFFLSDAHFRPHVIDHRRTDVEAAFAAGNDGAAAIDEHFCAFVFRLGDVAFDPALGRGGNHRADGFAGNELLCFAANLLDHFFDGSHGH